MREKFLFYRLKIGLNTGMVPPLRASFRSPANYAVAWASELASPVLSRWARGKASRPGTPPQNWRKGLLIGANHIGDILYRTCGLAELAAGLPACRWDIVAPSPACEALEGNPAIQKIHRFDLPDGAGAIGFRELQEENYDVAVCYDSGMYVRPLRLAVELGIPNRAAYVHKGFSALVTHPIPIHYPQPFPHYFKDLAASLTNVPPSGEVRPAVFIASEDREAAESWWQDAGLRAGCPVVAVFLSTRQPTGLWPTDRFAGVVRRLREENLAQVVLCGGPQDEDFLNGLKTGHGLDVPIMAGTLNLRELSHFLSKCRAVLCPDSGPRHLANAAETNVFFFRNLRSNAIETGKYCDTETDLSPDGEFLLPAQQQEILESISVESVVEKMRPVLGR